MLSLDVTLLFTIVRMDETISYVSRCIQENDITLGIPLEEIIGIHNILSPLNNK